jgi:hypothetical protein
MAPGMAPGKATNFSDTITLGKQPILCSAQLLQHAASSYDSQWNKLHSKDVANPSGINRADVRHELARASPEEDK